MRRRFVTFSGGLGAQVLSAAIYFDALESDATIYADLRYFEQPPHVAQPGDGRISIWPWALQGYGIEKEQFQSGIPRHFVDQRIVDGPEKAHLAYSALRKPGVQSTFPIPVTANAPDLPELSKAVVIHLRRGDYVNVASYLVPDADSIEAAAAFAAFLPTVIVLSDSAVPDASIRALQARFRHVIVPTDMSDIAAHGLMRRAGVLIASNSQFSLSAALLRDAGLALLPGQWFGAGQEALESLAQSLTGFRMLKQVAP